MKSVITKTESDMTSQPTACDNVLQDSNAEEASASAEIQSTSIPDATNDKAQGSPKAFTDLDYLDGPTVIAEVYPFFHVRVVTIMLTGLRQLPEPCETENNSATPRVSGCSPPPQYQCILMTYAAHNRPHR